MGWKLNQLGDTQDVAVPLVSPGVSLSLPGASLTLYLVEELVGER